jgi:hypothetical protein
MRAPRSEYRVRRSWKRRCWRRAQLLASLAAASLAACIVIPIPVDHTKGRAVDPQKTAIEIGASTREEIIAHAGEPDAVWEEERIIAYSWKHANWLLIMAAGGPGGAVGGAGYVYGDWMLLIQFDTSGRVARADRVERPSDKSYGEFLREWARGKPNANP